MKRFLLLAFAPVFLIAIPATSMAEGRTVKLLTIGNSFSRNATNHLDDLAKAGGHTLIHRPIVVGGASLELHATKAQKHEAAPDDKAGLYSNGRSLEDELLAEKWDYVTIQQASIKSHDPATYRPFADWLAAFIRKNAPTATLLFHQTWAYRGDDPRFTRPSDKPGEPKTQEEMYRGLTNAYRSLAKELGAGVLPVGDAFFLADTDPKWGFQADATFDPKIAKAPSLPDQTHSLHVGWRWAKPADGGEAELSMDGHHANLAGEYLGACVWYEILFGTSAVGNPYIPKGIEAEYARFLQETAHRAVEASAAMARP